MRILNIRFKNLNSLAGEWAIDLEDPAYIGDGIFAITGPTGAGKSTILDAICLALYGRTPRLGKITKSANEIMSRQTGECFAEVVFETAVGRFRCHWSQHRARRRATGELQVPRHEIADALSGNLLETKILEVAKCIEQATGMNFERFTRSMLLAQGSFAAFLQAAPDERAPILEQITGTGIYSRISIKVHERRIAERNRLAVLQAELAGVRLLDAAERQTLERQLSEHQEQDRQWQTQLTDDRQALDWLTTIHRLQKNLQCLEERKAALQVQQAAFAHEAARLQWAQRALELDGDYALLGQTRELQASDRRQLQCVEAELPNLVQQADLAARRCTTATQALEQVRQAQVSRTHDIRKARELDLKQQERQSAQKNAREILHRTDGELKALQAERIGLESGLEGDQAALEALQAAMQKRAGDVALAESLPGIEAVNTQFDHWVAEANQRRAAWQAACEQHRDEEKQHDVNAASLEATRDRLRNARHSLDQIEKHLQEARAGSNLQEWRVRLADVQRHQQRLEEARTAAQKLHSERHRHGELLQQQEALTRRQAGYRQTLQTYRKQHGVLEKEQVLLETQLLMTQRIHSLEQERHQLQNGQPCPLCGAVEHPFATGVIPQADGTKLQLQTARDSLKKLGDAVATVQAQQAECGRDQAHLATALQSCTDEIAQAQSALAAVGDVGAGDPEAPDWLAAVASCQQRAAAERQAIEARLQAVERMEQQVQSQKAALSVMREQVFEAEQQASQLAYNVQMAFGAVTTMQQRVDEAEQQQAALLATLRQSVAPFEAGRLDPDNRHTLLQVLAQRREQWLRWQKDSAAVDNRIMQSKNRLQWLVQAMDKAMHSQSEQRMALDRLTGQLEQLRQERQAVLGDLDPDAEERHLAEQVRVHEQQLDTLKAALSTAQKYVDEQQSRKSLLEQGLAKREQQLMKREHRFCDRLASAGFTDESQFQQARLSETARRDLEQRAQALATDAVAVQQDARRCAEDLATTQALALTDQSQEYLAARVETLAGQVQALQQQIGGIRQRLLEDESLRAQQQARVESIEIQERVRAQWDQLHALIGSADGGKYRNFAQGLTFDMMIGHANRQLQKMTDRYLLLRDPGQPLELNVIDSFQAGEVRSTKNLSGGESFIVSLALALGLSQMASRNVRVDSLFLDEGFGTLDEDALDMALETLSGLQQEGKLIGVISHVPSLRERISTQIRVTPRTGGRSRIEGPGTQCRV